MQTLMAADEEVGGSGWMKERLSAAEGKVLGALGEDERRVFEHSLTPAGVCVGRVYADVKRLRLYSAGFSWVPAGYYGWSLGERAGFLGTGKGALCKSMLMENVKFKEGGGGERYCLVVVQYVREIDVKKLAAEMRCLAPAKSRLPTSCFEFKVAKDASGAMITGFGHNAVSPLGLATPVQIVVDRSIKGYFFMGGGHADLKVGCEVGEFVRGVKAKVLDASKARPGV